MERRKNRMSVGGLRKAEPTTLAVLIQDVVRLPVTQIDPSTLLDLLALSEVPDQLATALGKELAAFRDQMQRDIGDLPDGPVLAEFLREFVDLDATLASASFRSIIEGLVGEREHADSVEGLDALKAHWDGTEPAALALPEASTTPHVESGSKAKVTKVKAKPKKRTTRSSVDPQREEWIVEDVTSRLVNYGNRGLKQPVVVAGSRHRSPWKDLTEKEVLATLRKMKREGKLRFSAGRWMMNS